MAEKRYGKDYVIGGSKRSARNRGLRGTTQSSGTAACKVIMRDGEVLMPAKFSVLQRNSESIPTEPASKLSGRTDQNQTQYDPARPGSRGAGQP